MLSGCRLVILRVVVGCRQSVGLHNHKNCEKVNNPFYAANKQSYD